MFEISVLPGEVAANVWTAFTVPELIKEVSMPIKPEKREFLVKHVGEDKTARLESLIGGLGKELEEAGIGWKEVLDEGEAAADPAPAPTPSGSSEPAAPAPAAPAEPAPAPVADPAPAAAPAAGQPAALPAGSEDPKEPIPAELAGVREAVQAAIAPIVVTVQELQTAVKALGQTDDEKQAAAMAAKGSPPPDPTQRPSESTQNVITDPPAGAPAAGDGSKEQSGKQDGQRFARGYVESFLMGGKSMSGDPGGGDNEPAT